MEKVDRRKFPRVKVFNPVHYDCVDKDGNLLVQNMGLALDISQNGILLETAHKIESKNIYLLFVVVDNELIRITARVVFSVQKKDGKYKAGINFQGAPKENIQFAKKIVEAYHQQKTDFVLETSAQLKN